jgi:hypothetical protein
MSSAALDHAGLGRAWPKSVAGRKSQLAEACEIMEALMAKAVHQRHDALAAQCMTPAMQLTEDAS